jgi:choline dehydrogenase-like flavoprotein
MKLDLADAPADPHAGVKVFADYRGKGFEDRCQVLVIGSGPGGSVVAKELAEAGVDVILLEEGPPFGARDFRTEAGESMHRTMRDGGTRAARGSTFMPTMQAIGLGGGSLINSAICARSPASVFTAWAKKTGIEGLDLASLEPHYRRVEETLSVAPTPMEVQGERNLRFKRGCDALGISSAPTHRNVRGCKGSGECFTGCRNGAKQSTDISYVPIALRHGARVYTSVRAEQLIVRGKRVAGVRGRMIAPFTWEEGEAVTIHAEQVVLAAGCMQTPVILLKSGVANGSGYVGRELQLHPGLAIMALYDEPIDPWKGATQGYHSLHFLEEHIKLEVLWSPPAVLAARLPGLGHDYQGHLLRYDRLAPFDVIVAAEHSSGVVTAKRGSFTPDIRFDFAQEDVSLLQRGLSILSDICWASGAVGVLPGLHGVPEMITRKEDADVLRTRKLVASDTISAANHAFGTTRMSRLPKDGVVDALGRCHEVENLYIADTGIFPGSPAVNPMLTCMALADRVAQGIVARG